ncbi:alpha/beta fold hydrolase [Pendulispora albinea]|uniref:Alpha/beta hydrolase n=1 Tax=Pendulispora albinea TaxID=2741071 RepID=A0ABZ2M5N3_9BACT
MRDSNEAGTPAWELPGVFHFEGQPIRYGSLGDGSPLVLLHGTPFSSIVWRRIAPYLAVHRRVFYFDLLGYGRSEMRAGQDVSLGVQNRLFAALLDHWGLDRPDVIAHDFGGTTALRTHLLNGRNYRSLTLIDPVAIGPSGSALVQHARQHEAVFAGVPAYIHSAILRAYIGGAAYRPLSEDVLQLYMAPWLGAEGQPAFYRQIAQMSDRYTDEIEHRYNEIRCPVAILWGARDAWIPTERGRALAQRIPNSTLRVVPDAGHLVQEDAPEAIVATVLDFLPKVR